MGAVREIPVRHGLPAVFGGVSRPGERQEALLNRCRLTKNRRAQLTRPQGVPTSTPNPRRLVKTGEDGVPPKIRDGQKIRPRIGRVAQQSPQTPMRRRGYTACGGACFRGAGPVPWHRHRRAVVPSHGLVAGDERRRTSRGRHSAPRAPQESGATIPGTRRRPGQTDTRARGSMIIGLLPDTRLQP